MLTFTTAFVFAATPLQEGPVSPVLPTASVTLGQDPHEPVPPVQGPVRGPVQAPYQDGVVAGTLTAEPLVSTVQIPEVQLPAKPTPEAGVPGSDIVVTGRKVESVGDPLRAVNATAFDATQVADRAIVGPMARAYKRNVPSPIRRGIHNFLYNLREPIVFLNFVLQFKPGKAAETVGRFVVNTTAGVAGVFDIAKRRPFRLPRRSNGFANTLGYYGVKNGPFLFLPIVGPTTLRDLIGGTVDRLILPTAVGKPFTSPTYTIPAGVLGAIDHRADFDETLTVLHDGVADPYASSREFYLSRRQAEIDHLHGRIERPELVPTNPKVDLAPLVRATQANQEPRVEPVPAPTPIPR